MGLEATSDLWWKNGVVYCVDPESFLDVNGDGIGDLRGLTQRIDYLAGLGVTCLWLMPFYPSPRRDHGYDVAEYYGVDPRIGTLGDLVELVRTARERGIRVVADLVVNHTSDQHAWFRAASTDRESPFHDFYVWSDERPADAEDGVIFPGDQETIWSYAKAVDRWYLHRFYPHQPDLNVNNPLVRNELHKVLGFWLELGLSGFRVDAVPFFIEQLGQHEAVRDPHDFLRDLRAFLSRRRGDAMLLAEANEPAERLTDFFGNAQGDQMHVLFNFIVNQAMYLALVRGDAAPVAKALRSLPERPATGQWANFVRNHDELSLDKLTDAEREEVFAAMAPEEGMRIYERGIRRRLPSMVDGDRRRMELMYSLAFTLPGIPVLFYGEEIGMGDDLTLPGRDAVRTAMQWTAEPNAGFSSAPRPALARPPVDNGAFAFRHVNVRRQREDARSLLNWMERAIRTRKEWPEFGWGDWELLRTDRSAVLAHSSHWQGGAVLALHNFSARSARVTLRLPKSGDGAGWQHAFGGTGPKELPADAGEVTLRLDAYGYCWYGRRARL